MAPGMIRIVEAILLPPMNIVVLMFIGLAVRRKWRGVGRGLIVFSFVFAYTASAPVITGGLLRSLEHATPGAAVSSDEAFFNRRAQAIVVLGGGSYFGAPEYGADTVGRATLERLRWAARIQRISKLPVLVSGGILPGGSTSEAQQMRDALSTDFGVTVRWLDPDSRDTFDSAFNSREILTKDSDINRIILVTHAWHMRRAQMVFERAGLDVFPAPTAFTTEGPARVLDFVPSAAGMQMAAIYLHEVLGWGWYHLRLLYHR